jgi:hypothetical protein
MQRPVTTAIAVSAVALAGAPAGIADPGYPTPSPTNAAPSPTVGGQPDYFGNKAGRQRKPGLWFERWLGHFLRRRYRSTWDSRGIRQAADAPNNFIVVPDAYTVVVETTSGRQFTQEAMVTAGKTAAYDSPAEKDFNFPTVDPSVVQEVLMTTSRGTCWVSGNP